MLKRFKNFKIQFEILNAANTMDGNDPALETFESNLRRILRARELVNRT